jgi:hypothetical protein
MSKVYLEDIFRDLAVNLPKASDGNESFIFTSENLPVALPQIETHNLYIKKGSHVYNSSFNVDRVDFNAHKETFKLIGLLILSAIFHSDPTKILVKLTHPESDITNLIIESEYLNLENICSGYHTKPFAFNYYSRLTKKHPFDENINPQHLPCFSLTNLKDFLNSEDDWKKRDTVRISGSNEGMSLFAELLLNASLPQNEQNEYELEGERGFRGVGINSAEVILSLPGNFFWFEEHWN